MHWRKGIGIHADAPAGLSSATHCLTREVEIKGKGEGQKQKLPRRQLQQQRPPSAMAIAKAIAEPLLLLIFLPLCSGGWAEEKPEGWPAWMPASLASGQDALSTNPAARPRTSPVADRRGAEAGRPLFWLLFSGHAEKSDSVAEGERNALALPSASDAPISPPTRPFGFTGNPKRSFSYEIFGSLNVQTQRMVAIQLPQRNTGRIRFPQPWPDRP